MTLAFLLTLGVVSVGVALWQRRTKRLRHRTKSTLVLPRRR